MHRYSQLPGLLWDLLELQDSTLSLSCGVVYTNTVSILRKSASAVQYAGSEHALLTQYALMQHDPQCYHGQLLASRIYCSCFLMLGVKVDGESNYFQVVIGLLYMASPVVASINYVPADAKALPRVGASASVRWKQEKGGPIDEHSRKHKLPVEALQRCGKV